MQVLDVVRERGTFGQVIASWTVTGDHNNGELTPSSGQVRQFICWNNDDMFNFSLLSQGAVC